MQAEAIAEAIVLHRSDLATKADIRELKNDINWLKWGLGININILFHLENADS